MDTKQQNHPGRVSLICLALFVITLVAFWPVGRLGFILHDDHQYVTDNPNIQAGITAKSVGWAFTATQASNWHPVTWLSHMLDYKLFGLNASGHHWVNLGFHIANTLLLFIVLRQMTQAVWRSALVAALFALHPMRVESVAWISERKDVLSVFFAMLTLWAYARYAQRVTGGKWQVTGKEEVIPARDSTLDTRHSTFFYWLALGFFALGLMSKPMLVTLPVIMLLLDFWPLKRISDFGFRISDLESVLQSHKGAWPRGAALRGFTPATLNCLLFEKVPFLVLSLASCIVTVWVQAKGGTVVSADRLLWYWRMVDSLEFYTFYLEKMFWPENLAIFYPYTRIPPWEFVCSALLPILLSVFCIRRMRSQPCLWVGWFWFVVMLLPVIGLVQAGMQSIADRYTYLPSIGLFIIAAWGMAGLASLSRIWRTSMTLSAAALLLACLLDTRYQLRYWRDSITLFSHAVEITREGNSMSYYLLGNAYGESGNLDEAARNFQATLRIDPNFEEARDQLGHVLFLQKKFEAAGAQFDEILQRNPYNANAHKHLGDTLAARKKYAEAEAEYSNALLASPNDAAISEALAVATLKAENEKTLTNLYCALKILPTPEIHIQIAIILAIKGEYPDAVRHYLEALRLKPDSPDVLNNLAWLLATCPDAHLRAGTQAVKQAERACELTHYTKTFYVGTLAAAYAEAGRFDDAIATAQKACALAEKSGEQNLLQRNQELLLLYQKHQPYHAVASPDQAVPPAANPASGDAEKLVPGAP
jgi:tetratricopeptide (TPR) repeat protein